MKTGGTRKAALPMQKQRRWQTGMVFGKGVLDSEMAALANRFENPKSEVYLRNRAIFAVLSRTGLRASELCSISWRRQVQTPDGCGSGSQKKGKQAKGKILKFEFHLLLRYNTERR